MSETNEKALQTRGSLSARKPLERRLNSNRSSVPKTKTDEPNDKAPVSRTVLDGGCVTIAIKMMTMR